MEKISRHLGQQVRAERRARGMTQEALAASLEMATESVSHIERGVTVPSLKTLAAAAHAFGISLGDFFVGLADDRPLTPKRAEQEARLRRLGQELDDERLAFLIGMAAAVKELP